MRAFIVRPFGIKNDINFEEVERALIAPALRRIGAESGMAIDIVQSGNIRVDVFQRLLTADLIVADLSIHNAGVFYELGIRHALRARATFMLHCDSVPFPFDLQTDRYFLYRKEDPGACLEDLVMALQRTKEAVETGAAAKDSPVFMSLPNLTEPDPCLFNPVPQDFGEDVERAVAEKRAGDLALFSYEVKGFDWEISGWRMVGTAQFNLGAMADAGATWESVRKNDPNDLEANIRLGTIYERIGDLTHSTQALERALKNQNIDRVKRAEAYSLLARNAKTRWRFEWECRAQEERPAAALGSPHLRDSFENYARAFEEDLNHYGAGLNSLAMLKIMVALAGALPDVWAEHFESDVKAEEALAEHREHSAKLAAGVELSLNATLRRLEREGRKDVWAEIGAADLACITSNSPLGVAAAYRKALAAAPDFAGGSVLKQLAIYRDLGMFRENVAEVFKVIGEPPPLPSHGAQPGLPPQHKRVLLFAGHMIDAPEREHPRFPADQEGVARERIREVLAKEVIRDAGVAWGYAGGASGGDILFHEVCSELGIPTRLFLALPPGHFVVQSVQNAGPRWVDRFWKLYNNHLALNRVRILSEATDVRADQEYLPAWLRSKPNYGIWQRNTLWMLFNALHESRHPGTGDPNITLIALWDGSAGDGPGGTGDLVHRIQDLGARCEILKTKELFAL